MNNDAKSTSLPLSPRIDTFLDFRFSCECRGLVNKVCYRICWLCDEWYSPSDVIPPTYPTPQAPSTPHTRASSDLTARLSIMVMNVITQSTIKYPLYQMCPYLHHNTNNNKHTIVNIYITHPNLYRWW